MMDDERAIRQFIDNRFAATKAGDLQVVLNLMTDDVVFMALGQIPFGRDKFTTAFEAMKGVQIDGRSDIQEILVLEDWAYLRSHIKMTITPLNGAALMHRAGYTLSILKKGSDGRWRLARDANLMASG
jgi:uncharacterized protein (TIGR02246 family)